jgi:hypothetical protein
MVTIILQRYGVFEDPSKVITKRFTCKTVHKIGDPDNVGYELVMPDGSTLRVVGGEDCDVAVVMPDGSLRAV